MKSAQHDIDERASLTANNKFELMLFRLGKSGDSTASELYGINVFKLRELVAMPEISTIANSPPCMMGVVNVRGRQSSWLGIPHAADVLSNLGFALIALWGMYRLAAA